MPATGPFAGLPDGGYTLGFRPHHLHLNDPGGQAVPLSAVVAVTEITGSESFVHLDYGEERWVAIAHGIHERPIDEPTEVWIDAARVFLFDAAGRLAASPEPARAA
jgi:glycerol transport system ATP-binding protein